MTQEEPGGPDHPHPTPPRAPWQGQSVACSVRLRGCASCPICARAPRHGADRSLHARCMKYVACGVLSVDSGALGAAWGAARGSRMATVGAVWSGICIKQIRKCLDPRPGLQHITTRCAVPHTWKMRATHRHGQRQRATARREGPRAKQEGSTPLRVGHRRAQPECEPHGTVTHKGTTKLRPRHLLLDIAAHGQRAEDVGDGGGRE